MARANRTSTRRHEDGKAWECTYYKTHKQIARILSTDTAWVAPQNANPTTEREDFRIWAQDHASDFGVDWEPELQTQSWARKFWKYENNEQVEEDAIELMLWTIRGICQKAGFGVDFGDVSLDSIVPQESNLSYVENGKYTKNGNWAVAIVNLEVNAEIEGSQISIIYPIEMRSGQLTKIKLTVNEIKAMVADNKVA